MNKMAIIGSIKPWRPIGDRYKVASVTGSIPTLLSSDYKDVKCVLVKRKKRKTE